MPPGLTHRLLGIDDQIEDHLLELLPIGHYREQIGPQLLDDLDVVYPEIVPAKVQRGSDQLVHRGGAFLTRTLSSKGEKVRNYLHRPFCFTIDRFQLSCQVLVGAPADKKLGFAPDPGKRIVELVGNARDELAYGC